MQKSLIRHPLTQVVFKSLVVFSALALMPVVWVWIERAARISPDIITYRHWATKEFFEMFWPVALVSLFCAVASVRWWWRKPRWHTALAVYFMLAVVCGAPGMAMLILLPYLAR